MGDPRASNIFKNNYVLVLRGSGRGGDEGVSCGPGGLLRGPKNRTVVSLVMVMAASKGGYSSGAFLQLLRCYSKS